MQKVSQSPRRCGSWESRSEVSSACARRARFRLSKRRVALASGECITISIAARLLQFRFSLGVERVKADSPLPHNPTSAETRGSRHHGPPRHWPYPAIGKSSRNPPTACRCSREPSPLENLRMTPQLYIIPEASLLSRFQTEALPGRRVARPCWEIGVCLYQAFRIIAATPTFREMLSGYA